MDKVRLRYSDIISKYTVAGSYVLNTSGELVGLSSLDKGKYRQKLMVNGKGVTYHNVIYCLYHKVDLHQGEVVDHIDGNGINNSKDNLRVTSIRGNNQNRKCHREGKISGVDVRKNQIRMRIRDNGGKHIEIYKFPTVESASEAYQYACNLLNDNIDRSTIIKEVRDRFIPPLPKKAPKVPRIPRPFPGVDFNKAAKKFRARVTVNGERIGIGYFDTPDKGFEAIQKYKEALGSRKTFENI